VGREVRTHVVRVVAIAGVAILAIALPIVLVSSLDDKRTRVEKRTTSVLVELTNGQLVECVAYRESITCDWDGP
jgi:hypothetical protein